jgi:glycosyltransferase involved in cell wall biosynthesis
MIKVGVYAPNEVAYSVRSYLNNLEPYLEQNHVKLFRFNAAHPLHEAVGLYWDPRAGRPGPHSSVQRIQQPYVVTFHGAGHISCPLRLVWQPAYKAYLLGSLRRIQTRYQWGQGISKSPARIIAVSGYAQHELKHHLGWNSTVIHHGIDHKLFNPIEKPKSDFLLHISTLVPKKNVPRIIRAYRQLDLPGKPRLVIISGGTRLKQKVLLQERIELVEQYMSHKDLAPYYQNALAFIFPSLHETFGMPISEAMAAGTPVITSFDTACAEIAGDAAILVDPNSTDAIMKAMHKICTDPELRVQLRQKGLVRAADFTWQRSARKHREIFQEILKE